MYCNFVLHVLFKELLWSQDQFSQGYGTIKYVLFSSIPQELKLYQKQTPQKKTEKKHYISDGGWKLKDS